MSAKIGAARAALDALLEVVADMPFANEAHKAAWIAATLTPPSRYAFHGPAPLSLIDANVRGCGKSLLTDCISEITAGREMARMALPRDDDEFRKRITALAIAAEPQILIDNISGTLGSPSLDAALTATSWSDRILGLTQMAANIPLYATWFATGNNVILAADTSRRTLHIRLTSREESPEEREGFRHPELLAWIRQDRARLAVAPVTILSAYYAAGRPNMRLKPWGSFEAWSALVRSAVVWAGMPDPAETRVELSRQSDREAVALRQLLAGWEEIDPDGKGITVAAMLEKMIAEPNKYAALRAALWELCPPREGKLFNPRSIGMKLHHLRERVIGGKYLDKKDEKNTAVWIVIRGTSGTGGTKPNHPAGAHTHAHACETPHVAGNSPTSPVTPPVRDVADPIGELARERELLATRRDQLAAVVAEERDLPPLETNPAIVSMHHGVDVTRRAREDAAAIAAGGDLPQYGDSRHEICARRREALQMCIAGSIQRIVDLEALSGPEIYSRDFAAKHEKSLRKMAQSLVDLLSACDEEESIARDALRAGCFPGANGFQCRPSLRLSSRSRLRQFLLSIRGEQVTVEGLLPSSPARPGLNLSAQPAHATQRRRVEGDSVADAHKPRVFKG